MAQLLAWLPWSAWGGGELAWDKNPHFKDRIKVGCQRLPPLPEREKERGLGVVAEASGKGPAQRFSAVSRANSVLGVIGRGIETRAADAAVPTCRSEVPSPFAPKGGRGPFGFLRTIYCHLSFHKYVGSTMNFPDICKQRVHFLFYVENLNEL